MTGRPRTIANAADRAAPGAIEAVLLDIDGTLLDSNDAHAQAWSDALDGGGLRDRLGDGAPADRHGADKLLPQLTGIDAESEAGQAARRATEGDLREGVSPVGAAVSPGARAARAHAAMTVCASSSRRRRATTSSTACSRR